MPRYRVRIPENFKDLLVGQTLADNYYVLSVIGHGGMSVVYKAKYLKKPRIVAIKTLRLQSSSDERTVLRFKREAELLSRLNHPRIVQVSFYGNTRLGQPYFVMDYLTGENLSNVFKRERALEPERVRHIFSQVCGAVDHAHRCGVIHRDLKPGNIMLIENDGKRDFVKVVDFGIARFEEEVQRLTRMGEVWGSPIYMSPEQVTGAQLDARSDVYSLGVVMYEALTGTVPYLGKNYVETMTMQIMAFPKPFSEVCPEKQLPPKLEKVVRKALEKEPDKRYQSMAELRAELEKSVQKTRKRALPPLREVRKPAANQPTGVARSSDKNAALTGRTSSAKNAALPGRTSSASNAALTGRTSSAKNAALPGRTSSANSTISGRNASIKGILPASKQSEKLPMPKPKREPFSLPHLALKVFLILSIWALAALITQVLCNGFNGLGELNPFRESEREPKSQSTDGTSSPPYSSIDPYTNQAPDATSAPVTNPAQPSRTLEQPIAAPTNWSQSTTPDAPSVAR
jgi:serine/threonine-protein kinase